MLKALAVVIVALVSINARGAVMVGWGSGTSGARQLWDSGSVASGASIATPVLDLSGLQGIEIQIDNTAGTAYRSLTLDSYLMDGTYVGTTTRVATVAYGTAPSGGHYHPGMVRGYLGPNPPGAAYGVYQLIDKTSAANGTLSETVATEGCVQVYGWANASASTTTVYGQDIDDAGVAMSPWGASSASAANAICLGTGCASSVGAGNWQINFPIGRRATFVTTAAGVGNTVRLVLRCRGVLPGIFSAQMGLPARAVLSLVSGGSGVARMTLWGW